MSIQTDVRSLGKNEEAKISVAEVRKTLDEIEACILEVMKSMDNRKEGETR